MQQKSKHYLFVALVFIVIAGTYLQSINKSSISTDQCVLVENRCKIHKDDMTLSIEFDQTPISEEEIALDISLSDAYFVSNAWVEGVNMYMGKSPIVFENEAKPSQGVMFLGSCHLDEMQWHLNITVIKKGTQSEQTFTVPFVTNNY